MRILVAHTGYGCETGCCGHVVGIAADGEDADDVVDHSFRSFRFDHPYYGGDFRAFAEKLVRQDFGEEHVKDLDWENCVVLDD